MSDPADDYPACPAGHDPGACPRPVWPHDAGWPRPKAKFEFSSSGEQLPEPVKLPAPWINGNHVLTGDWLSFRPDADRAFDERLCSVCGEAMPGTVILLRYTDETAGITSGPGAHPRCAALACKHCPHMNHRADEETGGYAHDGDDAGFDPDSDPFASSTYTVDADARPVTVAQIRRLAASDPLGELRLAARLTTAV